MTEKEIIGLVLSYGYAFGLLMLVEAMGKRFAWPSWITRKIIHIGAGMWVWGILYFFQQRLWGILPFASFIVLNYLFYRRQTFSQMDDDQSTLGTVYFAVSITILFLLMWWPKGPVDYAPLAVAGIMAMTWGDAFASLIGQSFGKRRYCVFSHYRTWLGSGVMFVFSFFAIAITLLIFSGSSQHPFSLNLPVEKILIISAIAAAIATISEALAPAGTDNLTVPLITAGCLYWLC
jgi:phytol kinase